MAAEPPPASLDVLDHGEVRELRLARPPVNALDPALVSGLRRAIEAAPGDGAAALVLSGRPGMFSAGLDVPQLLALDRPAIAAFLADLFALMEALARSPLPVAAALTGHSPAGGAVLALFCDHRVMAEPDPERPDKPYLFGLNEVHVGLAVPAVLQTALARLVGRHRAEELAVWGRLVDSREAHRLGLVDELAPAGEVVGRALAWSRDLLALPRRAMLQTRELARADLVAGFAGVAAQVERWTESWFGEETQGAMRALVARLRG
jgi:enoyl-CoA hydratase/carnithine racemase